jgi:hypothetical protein
MGNKEKLTLSYSYTPDSKNEQHREYCRKLTVHFRKMPERFINVFKEPVNGIQQDTHFIMEDDEKPKKFFKDLNRLFTEESHVNFRFKSLEELLEFYERIKNIEPKLELEDSTLKIISSPKKEEILNINELLKSPTTYTKQHTSPKTIYINHDHGNTI